MTEWLRGIPGYSRNVSTQYCLCERSNATWTVAQSYEFFHRAMNGQRPQNVVWVFPFHDRCWKVLEVASERTGIAIDLQALYQVAMSLHFEDWVRNVEFMEMIPDQWSYGPLRAHGNGRARGNGPRPTYRRAIYTPKSCSAFGTFVPYRKVDWRYPVEQEQGHHVAMEVLRRLRETVGHGFLITRFLDRTDKDVFARIPAEIRLVLFSFLEFSDMRNLRLASSACAAVAMTESFFEPMFSPYGRLGHLYPFAMDYFLTSELKWGKTVNCALRLQRNKDMEERGIVWKSCLELLHLIKNRVESPICHGKETYHRLANRSDTPSPPRKEWQDQYRGEDPPSMKRWVYVPHPLGEVRASTMRLKERTFITGLSFISKKREKVELGYIHPNSEMTIWTSHLSSSARIYHFDIAIDAMGIRGIRAASNRKTIPWAGHYDEQTMSKLRVTMKRLDIRRGHSTSFLEGYFDVRALNLLTQIMYLLTYY